MYSAFTCASTVPAQAKSSAAESSSSEKLDSTQRTAIIPYDTLATYTGREPAGIAARTCSGETEPAKSCSGPPNGSTFTV